MFVICIKNDGYPVSLEIGKSYDVIQNPIAERYGLIHIIDESKQSYFYPQEYFKPANKNNEG